MKTYILYLATLLVALVLPAHGQTLGTDTKAAPADPAMPYKLTVQSIDGNNGTVIFADNAGADKGGVFTTGSDTFAYSSATEATTTTVKLTVTPNEGYVLDYGYPKAYKTGDATTTVAIGADGTFKMPAHPVTIEVKYFKPTDLNLATLTDATTLTCDASGSKNRWFYQVGITGTITPFTGTLTGTTNWKLTVDVSGSTAGNLYLANGTVTGSIEVNNSNSKALYLLVEESGTATVKGGIDVTQGALNCGEDEYGILNVYGEVTGTDQSIWNLMRWTWTNAPADGATITVTTPLEKPITSFTGDGNNTAFATNTVSSVKVLVDGVAQQDGSGQSTFTDRQAPYTGLKDSKPIEDIDDIIILNEYTYKEGVEPDKKNFSGTITGTVSSIKVDYITGYVVLNEIKKKSGSDNTIEVNKRITFALKGTGNEVSTINVAASFGDLILTTVVGGGSFATPLPTINNEGTFTSETRLIKEVLGSAYLRVTAEPTNKAIASGETHTLKVEASSAPATRATLRSTDPILSYQWQSYDPKKDTWTDISSATNSEYTTAEVGTYRCKITSTNASDMNNWTTLITRAAEITVKSTPDPTPDPDPMPTLYTVTLPTLVGATTNPVAGVHSVEAWSSFVFALTLSKDYDQSIPVVTTSRGETITPRATDGKYVVSAVRENITIQITGIMSNIPTGIAGTETGDRVWTTSGQLCIHTDSPKDVHIYNFSGQLQKVAHALYGDTNWTLPAGNYIVVIGSRSYKIQVSR